MRVQESILALEASCSQIPHEPLMPDTWTDPATGEYMWREQRYEFLRTSVDYRNAWEAAFVQKHGQPPNEQQRAASPRYRKAAASYARLRDDIKAAQAARLVSVPPCLWPHASDAMAPRLYGCSSTKVVAPGL